MSARCARAARHVSEWRHTGHLARGLGTLKEREGFGSFHSEDIERLIRLPDSVYQIPEIYSQVTSRTLSSSVLSTLGSLGFGKEVQEALFTLDPTVTFLNHGAFGAALKPLQLEAEEWRRQLEAQPLRFFDRQLLPLVAHSLRAMATHLGCSATDLLPLPNVTAGLNSVFASLEPMLGPGDLIACTALSYGSTKKMLAALAKRTGCTLLIIPVTLPVSSDAGSVVKDIIDGLGSAPHLRLLVVDSVTSNTAIKLPVGRIARAVRTRQLAPPQDLVNSSEVIIVADAAHSLQSDDNIFLPSTESTATEPKDDRSLEGVDAWLTNGHKWACMPRGAAFMWVGPRLRPMLRPAIISHGTDVVVPVPSTYSSIEPCDVAMNPSREKNATSRDSRLLSEFAWDGCRDYAALLTAPSAMTIWKNLPGARKYNSELLLTASAFLVDAWRPSLPNSLFHLPTGKDTPAAFCGSMLLVPLPDRVNGISTYRGCSDKDAFQLQNLLYSQNIEVPVKCIEGRLYLRLSCHIYNTIDQYHYLAKVVSTF